MRKCVHFLMSMMFFGGAMMFFWCVLFATYLWRIEDVLWAIFAGMGACGGLLSLLVGWVYPRVWDEL